MPEELDDAVARELREQPQSVQYALARILREESALLTEFLEEHGYLDHDAVEHASTVELTRSQHMIADCLGSMDVPRTADEIVDYIEAECPELSEEYKSTQHRPWLSTKLNELVEAGRLGRYNEGRKVKYTNTPLAAVRGWAEQNGLYPEEISMRREGAIADDTGMPRTEVTNAIKALRDG